jgi:hypothetical protein
VKFGKGKLVSGKYWQLVMWGEIPAGLAPEQWAAMVSAGVNVSVQIMPAVSQLHFGVSAEPPTQPGDGGSPLHVA